MRDIAYQKLKINTMKWTMRMTGKILRVLIAKILQICQFQVRKRYIKMKNNLLIFLIREEERKTHPL